MFGKIVFVVAVMFFVALIGLLGKELVEFTIQRTTTGDTLASYWGFWLLWLGPLVIGVSAIIGGINAWLNPQPSEPKNRPQTIDSWILRH